jgi:polysaccharide pyruvyl transferase WcaK-like protein
MKFLIHGYLGFKNLGDELILSKVIEDIRSAARDAEITVVTIDKDYTRRIHNVEGVVDRISPDAVWEAVKEADVIVVGGGGLIQEYNDIAITDFFKSFGYGIVSYALVPFLAKILRKPVFYWSHGVGPFLPKKGKNLPGGFIPSPT